MPIIQDVETNEVEDAHHMIYNRHHLNRVLLPGCPSRGAKFSNDEFDKEMIETLFLQATATGGSRRIFYDFSSSADWFDSIWFCNNLPIVTQNLNFGALQPPPDCELVSRIFLKQSLIKSNCANTFVTHTPTHYTIFISPATLSTTQNTNLSLQRSLGRLGGLAKVFHFC